MSGMYRVKSTCYNYDSVFHLSSPEPCSVPFSFLFSNFSKLVLAMSDNLMSKSLANTAIYQRQSPISLLISDTSLSSLLSEPSLIIFFTLFATSPASPVSPNVGYIMACTLGYIAVVLATFWYISRSLTFLYLLDSLL